MWSQTVAAVSIQSSICLFLALFLVSTRAARLILFSSSSSHCQGCPKYNEYVLFTGTPQTCNVTTMATPLRYHTWNVSMWHQSSYFFWHGFSCLVDLQFLEFVFSAQAFHSSSLLLVYLCGSITAPLLLWHMYYSLMSHFQKDPGTVWLTHIPEYLLIHRKSYRHGDIEQCHHTSESLLVWYRPTFHNCGS